jgi:hypothetical protein
MTPNSRYTVFSVLLDLWTNTRQAFRISPPCSDKGLRAIGRFMACHIIVEGVPPTHEILGTCCVIRNSINVKSFLLHVLFTGCTTLAQSLHPVVKDAFQGYFFTGMHVTSASAGASRSWQIKHSGGRVHNFGAKRREMSCSECNSTESPIVAP